MRKLTLDECLELAMQNHRRRPASPSAVAMADAQHRQALAGYWPQLNVKGAYLHTNETPNFLFPASNMTISAQSINVSGGAATVTIPANAFGPGFPPRDVQMPVSYPGQTIKTQAGQIPVPAQDVKLMNPDSFALSLNATWRAPVAAGHSDSWTPACARVTHKGP